MTEMLTIKNKIKMLYYSVDGQMKIMKYCYEKTKNVYETYVIFEKYQIRQINNFRKFTIEFS